MSLLIMILLIMIFLFFLLLFIPIKVKINLYVQTKNNNVNGKFDVDNQIKIYILEWFKIKTIHSHEKDKIKSTGKNKKINNRNTNVTKRVMDSLFKSVEKFVDYEKKEKFLVGKKDLIKFKNHLYFKEFYLRLGFNLNDPIFNAYMMALLNAFINMYLAKHAHQFNLKNTAYQTYLSDKIIDFHFSSIIKFKLVNTIGMMIKLIIHSRKVVEKNG